MLGNFGICDGGCMVGPHGEEPINCFMVVSYREYGFYCDIITQVTSKVLAPTCLTVGTM
jgi:hypothetical protein